MKPRAAVSLLIGASLAIALLLAKTVGVTYDEPPYLGFAWAYLHGGPKEAAREYPPVPSYLRGFALAAAGASAPKPPPGLVAGPVEPHAFGQLFLFFNEVPAEKLSFYARAAGLSLFAVLLGSVFFWGGLFALFFAAFDPNLLAHASLATTDVPFTAFFILSLSLWPLSPMAAGAAGGLALGSKATAVVLPLIVLILGRTRPKAVLTYCLTMLTVAVLCYVPSGAVGFINMLSFRFTQTASPAPTYLFGRSYPQGHPFYFPLILLVKTSLPLLFLSVWGLWDKKKLPSRETVLVAGSILLLAAMSARRQLGVRYVLALYPLLAVAAGDAAASLWKKGGKSRALAGVFVAWHAASSLAALPHSLSYANEAFGGPAAAWRLMGDSNTDWGQSLPDLKDWLDANPGGLILSYFGRDCAARLGLARQDAFSTPGPCPGSTLLPIDAGREWLAISATKRQGFYESGPPAFGWLDSRVPAAVVGRSILVYDLSRDADAHDKLAGMYAATGAPAAAARETARARFIRAEKKAPRR